jgi:sporulation protein YlmC with PRC-barrel domain
MQFDLDASVKTASGEDAGRVDRVVIDPATGNVSHLVVRKGLILTEDKVVPIDMVAEAHDGEVRLNAPAADLDELPLFEETHYVPVEEASEPGGGVGAELERQAPPFYWYPPVVGFRPLAYAGPILYGYPGPGYIAETERNIPEGAVPVRQDSTVTDRSGGEIGRLERVFTDAATGRATHLVIAQGFINKTRRLIPVHWVRHVSDDSVQLAVSRHLIEGLEQFRD